jgi:hypothetical protein
MIARCSNPNHIGYKRYGGRGITVCERWKGEHGFENFLADMGERPRGKSLDRYPDNDGNYEPGNCRWATLPEQNSNQRTNTLVPLGNRKVSMAEFCRIHKVPYRKFQTLYVKRKKSAQEALAALSHLPPYENIQPY